MLAVHGLGKSFNLTTLFEAVTFTINPGERVGLIGPNGSGKSTLLRIIAGVEAADAGVVTFTPDDLRLGYLTQGLTLPPEQPLGAALAALPGNPEHLERELARLGSALAAAPADDALQRAYDRTLHALSTSDANAVQQVVAALGLDQLDPTLPVGKLSGGEQTRLGLALACLDDPRLLLLDEPTNHLDIDMIDWLEDWLADFNGAALIVSHDRSLLDRTVTRVLDIDPEHKRVSGYAGNYSDYLEQIITNRATQMDAWKRQEAEIRRIRADIARTREQAMGVERTTTPRSPGVRRIAKKVMVKALSREKKLERFLASDERVEKPKQGWQLKLDFVAPEMGKQVLRTDKLAVGYDTPLLSDLDLNVRAGQRVAVVGRNGAGKTTLIRTLVGKHPPLSGSVWLGPSVRLGYMSQMQRQFAPDDTPVRVIQAVAGMNETDTRNFLHFFLFGGDESLKPVSQLSYGQRSRLELGRLVAMGCNVLILDEPINHLDIPSRANFEQALAAFDGTVIAVVHDRYFIARFASDIWRVADGKVQLV